MNKIDIIQLSQLDYEYKVKSIDIFVDSFYDLFKSISRDSNTLKNLFLSSIDFSLIYVAIKEDEVFGMMGLETNKKRMMSFDKYRCIELFGKIKGSIIYYQLSHMLQKPKLKNDKDIGIDYLATDKNLRGKGVATKLLEYALNEMWYKDYYIDVLSSNTTAKNLYENMGFKEYKREYSLQSLLERHSYICKMKK